VQRRRVHRKQEQDQHAVEAFHGALLSLRFP
jgi:hypothetical protein